MFGVVESRSMVMTPKELDDLAYLLFANVHRAEYERIVDPQEVEERKFDSIYLVMGKRLLSLPERMHHSN